MVRVVLVRFPFGDRVGVESRIVSLGKFDEGSKGISQTLTL